MELEYRPYALKHKYLITSPKKQTFTNQGEDQQCVLYDESLSSSKFGLSDLASMT